VRLADRDVISTAYVICLRPAECVSGRVHTHLARLGLAVEAVAAAFPAGPPHDASAPSEDDGRHRAGRASLAAVLHRARAAEAAEGGTRVSGAVLVVEEAAVLRRDFGPALTALLSRPRCCCQLWPGHGCPPGVLVLSPAAHRVSARLLYDTEGDRHRASGGRDGGGAEEADGGSAKEAECVNLLPDTNVGAALVFAREALPLTLALLEQPHYAPVEAAAQPADRAWTAGGGAGEGAGQVLTELALAGLVVRAAWPPIVLTDLATATDGTEYGSLRPQGPEAADGYRRLGWDRLGFDPNPMLAPHLHPLLSTPPQIAPVFMQLLAPRSDASQLVYRSEPGPASTGPAASSGLEQKPTGISPSEAP
jgi:hypothetical protein